MTRKATRQAPAAIIECQRGKGPRCDRCGEPAEHKCSYPLRGAREGERCGRLLCARCAREGDGGALCGPHHRLLEGDDR